MTKTKKTVKKDTQETLESANFTEGQIQIQADYYQTVARLGEIQMLFRDLNAESQTLVAKVEKLREEFKAKQA